jgi:hypothetical protein
MEQHKKRLASSSCTAEERAQSQAMINVFQSLFAPVRRLPSEILLEIFRQYIAPPQADHLPHQVSPLVLASVCAFWRSTALSSPTLWAHVKISAQGDFYTSPRVDNRQAESVRFWMDHVGNHQPWSLSIVLNGVVSPTTSQPQTRQRVTPLANLLGHQSISKLHELRIDAEEPITGVEALTFPALESLLVLWRQPNHHIQTLDTPFPTVPNLTKLVIVNAITLNSNTSTTNLPWSRLTHLFIEGITMQKWRMVVGQCLELREGCFSVEEPTQHIAEIMSDDVHITPTALTHLQKLTFLNKPPFHKDFQQLSFPALEELNVVFGQEDIGLGLHGGWRQDTLAAFHDVKRIMVVGNQARIASLENTVSLLLDATPFVERLEVDIKCDAGALLQLLTSDPSKLRLAQLQTFDITPNFEGSDHRSFPLAALDALVQSRGCPMASASRGGSSPSLKQVTLRLPKAADFRDVRRSIDDMSRQLKHGTVRVDVVEESAPSGVVPPNEDSGEYRHWNDGLMEFLVRA